MADALAPQQDETEAVMIVMQRTAEKSSETSSWILEFVHHRS